MISDTHGIRIVFVDGEQGTENPCVGGSIPFPATLQTLCKSTVYKEYFVFYISGEIYSIGTYWDIEWWLLILKSHENAILVDLMSRR